ncbi:hypothetical protein [Rhodococcus qingshengii]|uniref:hypothetical protein n=1 Tax=Rhodococcus qingshengii TaxID=334542 RepID=UPI001AE0E4C4|nr:hypothetical protein [Rhodococcus qingshengii]
MPKAKHLIVSISAGILSGVIVGGLVVSISNNVDWGADQLGNLSTWIAGIGTLAAVVVAVWQTNNANRHAAAVAEKAKSDAAKAEERHSEQLRQAASEAAAVAVRHSEQLAQAQRTLDVQVARDLDTREHAAVRAISAHAANVILEVTHFSEVAKIQFAHPGELTTAELLSMQKKVTTTSHQAIVEVRLAFTQLSTTSLLQCAAKVHIALTAVLECISNRDPDRTEADWPLASQRTVQIADASSQLVDAAVHRFNSGIVLPEP